MHDLPKAPDLVGLAADFLRAEIMPLVSGAANFQLRVAINALDLAARELRTAAETDAAEHARLVALLGREGPLDELNRALCDAIATGAVTADTPGLTDHLWATTMAKLAVDQPTYAAYRRERERDGHVVPSPRVRGEG